MRERRFKGRLSSLVKEELIQMIGQESLKPGDKLLSEERLALQFNVSRPTLREALRILEAEGYVERRQGRGTFVRERTHLQSGLEQWKSISAMVEEIAKKVGSKLLRLEEGTFSREIHHKLHIGEEELCIRLERIRTADCDPVSYSVDYVPRRVFGYTKLSAALFSGSLVHLMEEVYGVRVCYSRTNLVPVVADVELAATLMICPGSPVLLLDEVHYDRKDQVVFLGKDYFPYEKVKFHLLRQRATEGTWG